MEEVNQSVWDACGGVVHRLPPVSSVVRYFPQGRVEHCNSPLLSSLLAQMPSIRCRVVSLKHLADPVTDQVFARLTLHQLQPDETFDAQASPAPTLVEDYVDYGFVKKLERYDVRYHLGCNFSAEDDWFLNHIFSTENMMISVRDIHKVEWRFQHTYTDGRHKLTTGWEEFVAKKDLCTGDSVLFLKSKKGEITLGIRRADASTRLLHVDALARVLGQTFRRKKDIEVVYYPTPGSSSFVVDEVEVEKSIFLPGWKYGKTVEKREMLNYSLDTVWRVGEVDGVIDELYRDNPWKTVKVRWLDPEEEKLSEGELINSWEIRSGSRF